MKIVNFLGGLGNQMFEYAMFLALREAHPREEILCSTRSFRGYGLHNGFELKRIFGISPKEASLFKLQKLAYPFFNYKSWQFMRHCLPQRRSMALGTTMIPFESSEITRSDSVFYDGYWQNESNFVHVRKAVLKAFSFPAFEDELNIGLSERIKRGNTVSCHIRRGDYLKEPNMCVCTPKYYELAIRYILERVNPDLFCIFSDDMDWCRKNIPQFVGKRVEVEFVDWNKGLESFRDMQLMSMCKHNIIANSSFSWWGAWLNQYQDKSILTPLKWMQHDILNSPICENWIRISIE